MCFSFISCVFQRSRSQSSRRKCSGRSDTLQHNESPQGHFLEAPGEREGPLSSSALTQCPSPAPGPDRGPRLSRVSRPHTPSPPSVRRPTADTTGSSLFFFSTQVPRPPPGEHDIKRGWLDIRGLCLKNLQNTLKWPDWKRKKKLYREETTAPLLFLSVCKSVVILLYNDGVEKKKNRVNLSVSQCPKKRLSRVFYRISLHTSLESHPYL